jgi:hypothetical protein
VAISLKVHRDFQSVRYLPFCYICGRDFIDADVVDGDHVPPRAIFNSRDREPALKLKTHRACNVRLSVDDKKIGQLIALRRFEGPKSARDMALKFVHYSGTGVAVDNLNVDKAVWRWVMGFHAALYRAPLLGNWHAITTPFPRGDKHYGAEQIRPIPKQHLLAVETIKYNRATGNIDQVVANRQQLRFECVWCQADDGVRWSCMFALDVYDWKDLGSHTKEIPARGCAGVYALPDFSVPKGAAAGRPPTILIPNWDALDPFAP